MPTKDTPWLVVVLALASAPPSAAAKPRLSSIALSYVTHTSVRVSWVASEASYMQVKFGTASGRYPYRTYTQRGYEKAAAMAINGLKPATTYFLRVTARPNASNDLDLCETDDCGATEQSFTTSPEPSPHPAPPAPPKTFSTSPPDTTGYTVQTAKQNPDGTCNLQELVDAAGYGTVIEIPQRMTCKIAPNRLSAAGLCLRIKPLDPKAGGDIHSPLHRWIVIRSAAGPEKLPPYGVRVTPAMAAPFAKLEAQKPVSVGEVMWTEIGRSGCQQPNCEAPHHYRIESLELTIANNPVLFPPDAADPAPMNLLIALQPQFSKNGVPTHVYFDRLYIHGHGAPSRVRMAAMLGGRYLALTNSFIHKIDYWRPYQTPDAPAQLSPDRRMISIPARVFQRNKFEKPWAMAQPATVGISAGPAFRGAFTGYLEPGGVVLEYTDSNPAAKAEANFYCVGCTAVKKATGDPPSRGFRWFDGTIANGQFQLVNPLFGTSRYASEGSMALYSSDGEGPYVFDNNYMEAYGINYFIDGPGGAEPIADVTFRRNNLFWNQDHRITSATTNGFVYLVRNNWEIKRGRRFLVEGNVMEGNWSNVNQGSSLMLSSRPPGKVEWGQGTNDITIRSNVIRNASAGMYCQGTSMSFSDPPATGNVLIENNLMYGIDQWELEHASPNGKGDNLRILAGCHDVTVRNNTFGSNIGKGPNQLVSGLIWNEGLVFRDNLMYLNTGEYNYGGLSTDSSHDTHKPYAPAMSPAGFRAGLDAAYVRIGATVEPNYIFTNNVIVVGGKAPAKKEFTDFSMKDLIGFRSQYPPGNLFPTGATMAEREAAVKFTNLAGRNFRLRPDSPYRGAAANGKDIGVDQDELEAASGLVTKVAPRAAGPDTVIFSYTAPDSRACWTDTSSNRYASFNRANDGGGERARQVTVGGLEPGKEHFFRILCYYEQVNDREHPNAYPPDQTTSGSFRIAANGGR